MADIPVSQVTGLALFGDRFMNKACSGALCRCESQVAAQVPVCTQPSSRHWEANHCRLLQHAIPCCR